MIENEAHNPTTTSSPPWPSRCAATRTRRNRHVGLLTTLTEAPKQNTQQHYHRWRPAV